MISDLATDLFEPPHLRTLARKEHRVHIFLNSINVTDQCTGAWEHLGKVELLAVNYARQFYVDLWKEPHGVVRLTKFGHVQIRVVSDAQAVHFRALPLERKRPIVA